jgi:hypothetical protein
MNAEDRVIGAMRCFSTRALPVLVGLIGLLGTPGAALAASHHSVDRSPAAGSPAVTPAPAAAPDCSISGLRERPTAAAHDLFGTTGDFGPDPVAALLSASPKVEHPAAEHRRPLSSRPTAAGTGLAARQAGVAIGAARRLPGRPAGLAAPLRRGPPAPAPA